jgi:DNA-directed RNA polymerase specialized sigma24 family protein
MTNPAKGAARWLPGARAGSPEALGELLEACRGYLRPHEEIARLMNRSPNATRQLLVRAIERLQKELRGSV